MPTFVLGYLALLVYGSLYPFSGWTIPNDPLFSFLGYWPTKLEKADVVQNVLVYAPLGLLTVSWLVRTMGFKPALFFATFAGIALSFSIESIQQFIPSRTSSTSDLVMNLIGTLAGGIIAAFLTRKTLSGTALIAFRNQQFRAGSLPNIGLVAIGLWALSQTSPLVPSLDISHLRHGLSLLFHALQSPTDLGISKTLTYAFYITGLGLVAATILHRDKPVSVIFLGFVALILISKVLIEERQLSLEALGGALAGGILLLALRSLTRREAAFSFCGIVFIATGFTISELTPVPGMAQLPFNWIPFSGQMSSINGLQNILDLFWPFFAIAYFTRHIVSAYSRFTASRIKGIAIIASLLIFASLFVLEWLQQNLPGRYGDITQVMVGFSGWVIPWLLNLADPSNQSKAANQDKT